MELVETSEVMRMADMARAMLVIDNYGWLEREASRMGITVVPLKGVDLLRTLYRESYDRRVSDIDIYCSGEEDCRRLVDFLLLNDYRLEFPFAMQPETLKAKRKVSLISCSMNKVNIDLHTALVTKKFFSPSVSRFNHDAVLRCGTDGMDPLDRWLFLAQHAAFHNYSDPKWVRDLRLLYDGMSEEERVRLKCLAEEYGFRRVRLATLVRMGERTGAVRGEQDGIGGLKGGESISSAERRFLRYVETGAREMTRSVRDRIMTAYWEFIFITSGKERRRAYRRLFFPSPGNLINIYRIRHRWAMPLYYPVNMLVSAVTGSLFTLDYYRRR